MPHECTTCGHVFADGSKEMLSGCPDCGGNKFQFNPAAATEREGTTPAGKRHDATPATERHDATPATERHDATATGQREQPASSTAGPDGTHDDRDETPSDAADPQRDLSEGSTEWPDNGYGSAADSEAADSNPAASDSSAPDPSAPEFSPTDAVAGAGDSDPTADSVDAGATDAEGTDTGTGSGPTLDRSPEDPAQADARSDVVSPDEIAAATPEETEGTATPGAPGSPATHDDDRPADTTDSATESTPDDRPGLEGLRKELNEQFESIRIVAPGEYELNLMELYDRTEYIISLQEDGRYIIEVPDTWDTTPDPDET